MSTTLKRNCKLHEDCWIADRQAMAEGRYEAEHDTGTEPTSTLPTTDITPATAQELSELAARFYVAADAVGQALASFTPHQRLLILSNCIANEVNETLAANEN